MRKPLVFLLVLVSSLMIATGVLADQQSYHHFELLYVYFQNEFYKPIDVKISGEIDVVDSYMYVNLNLHTDDLSSQPTVFMGNIELTNGNLYLINEPFEINVPMTWSFPLEEIILYFDNISYIFTEDNNFNYRTTKISNIDISSYTYEQLLFLQEQITDAMYINDEYQEVIVPIGVYQVGIDIPAGHWTIKTLDDPNVEKTEISWGEQLSDTKESISWSGKSSVYNTVYNPNYKRYNSRDTQTQYNFTVYAGDYIVIKYSSAVFTPYMIQSFEFK